MIAEKNENGTTQRFIRVDFNDFIYSCTEHRKKYVTSVLSHFTPWDQSMSMSEPEAFVRLTACQKIKIDDFVLFCRLPNVPDPYSLDIAFLFGVHENKIHHLFLAFPIINHSPFNDIQKGERYTIQVAVPFPFFCYLNTTNSVAFHQ